MIKTELKNIAKGGLFRLVKNSDSPTVWVKDYYDRSARKYWIYKLEDVNRGNLRKGNFQVYAISEFDLKKGCR